MKTYQPKAKEVKRSWHLVDAKDQILGRLATKIAILLTGKGKAEYSAHMDSGDYVVVINAEQIVVTGKKAQQKLYRSHSGYPGGFKEVKYAEMMVKDPARIIELAVTGMLPDNRLKRDRMKRLRVVVGKDHKYEDKFQK